MRLPSLLPPFSANAIAAVALPLGLAFLGHRLLKRVQFAGKDEQVRSRERQALHAANDGAVAQVLLKLLTAKGVRNGPCIVFPNPLTTLSYKKRKGISLTALQCGCAIPCCTCNTCAHKPPPLHVCAAHACP